MNKTSALQLTLIITAALLMIACGLKGDLYLPEEEPAVTPEKSQNPADNIAEKEGVGEGDEEKESGQASAPTT